MTIIYHDNIIQGSEEWHAMRCGLLTASEMKLIITPTLKIASNEKERQHLYELAAQRITKYVEPHYISDDMLRGHDNEILARAKYAEKYAPIKEVGFITNNKWGFTLGYSPDGLVGDDGQIEAKSRRQKYQVEAIVSNEVDTDFVIQLQSGLVTSERKWVDFISYHGGMPMFVKRVYPDVKIQMAILEASAAFHDRLKVVMERYEFAATKFFPTERVIEEEMI